MDTPVWNPRSLLELSGSYWKASALHAATALELFDAIGPERLSADEIARRTACSARGTPMLLRVLAAMGLLVRQGALYANSLESLRYLCRSSPEYVGFMIRHHHQLMPSWAELPRALREGAPVRSRISFADAGARENFLMGMFTNAMSIAGRLAQELDLSSRRRLLDLGGGPGTYAIHFCLQNPELTAIVFDLPTTKPFADSVIERFGVQHRVGFVSGDFTSDPLPTPFDAAWLSHILHAESPEHAAHLVMRAANSLSPGGMLLIHEFILDDDGDGPLFPALFALNMLTGTEAGRSYSEAELRAMMTAAGLRDLRRLPFRGPTESGILCGTKI
jgi:SAM-dependent methyltransferase